MTTSRLLRFVLLIGFLLSILLLQSQGSFAVPPDACIEVIFYEEDHESGAIGWTPSPHSYGTDGSILVAWSMRTGSSHSGSWYWGTDEAGVPTESWLRSPTLTIPATATNELFLRFYHTYNNANDPGDDGGIVEVSVNGGAFTDVGLINFTQNGYPRSLNGNLMGWGSRPAFTGAKPDFPAYMESIVDLSSLVQPSDTLAIRFHYGTDEWDGGPGWFVDDVELGYCGATNSPPIAPPLSGTILEDTSFVSSIFGSDPDGDPLTYSLGTAPSHGAAFVQPNGSFTYTPAPNFSGSDSFTVLVTDSHAATNIANVSITIDPVNDPPSFSLSGNPPAVNEDAGMQTIFGFATNISAGPTIDETPQILTFNAAVTSTTGNLTFLASPALDAIGTLSYAAAANAHGTATVQVRLSDSGGTANGGSDTSAVQTFTITVNPVNDPPVANDVTTTTPEDTTLSGSLTASDADGDSLTYALGSQAANGTAAINADGSFSYTPNADFSGTDSFTFTVSDGSSTDTGLVTVAVGSVNDNPIVTAGADFTADPNTAVSVSATYTDADSADTHTATIDWGDGSAVENVPASGGTVTGSHTYTSSGNFTVTITVTDSAAASGSDSLIISVNAPTLTASPTATNTATATTTVPPTGTATLTSPTMTPTTAPNISPTNTVEAPPPAPLAVDVNANHDSIVRTGIPDRFYNDIHIREIIVNGAYPLWLGSPSTNAGYIGNAGVLAMGVRQAVDIFSPTGLTYFEGGIVICLRGEGTLVYLNANNAPRIAEIVGSYEVPEFPGFTCVTLFEPGTLVLVDPVS